MVEEIISEPPGVVPNENDCVPEVSAVIAFIIKASILTPLGIIVKIHP